MTQSFATPQGSATRNAALWAAVLAVAAVLGSWALACAMPFAAFAAVTARTLRLREALTTMGVIWLANQAIGFLVLDYPHDTTTMLWGLALGVAALLSCLVASRVLTIARPVSQRLPLAFIAAYAIYELSLVPVAAALGGFHSLSPAIIAEVGMVNVLWFAVLAMIGEVLMRRGLLGVSQAARLPA